MIGATNRCADCKLPYDECNDNDYCHCKECVEIYGCPKDCEKLLRWFVEMPDQFKTREICEYVVNKDAEMFQYVPDRLVTTPMCKDAVFDDLRNLRFVPDHIIPDVCGSVMQDIKDFEEEVEKVADLIMQAAERGMQAIERLDIYWEKEIEDTENVFEWARKCQHKNKFNGIHAELLPVAWHPDRHWDWCMSEDEKSEISKLWNSTETTPKDIAAS